MLGQLEPNTSNYDGLTENERGPWYKLLWDSLSRLNGCKLGIGVIPFLLVIPGNAPNVKIFAVAVIGILALGDEFVKSKYYAEYQNNAEAQEAKP